MLTVITLLKVKPSPNGEKHGERPFWREHARRYLDAWLTNVRKWIPDPKRSVVMTDVPTLIVPEDAIPGDLEFAVEAVPLDEHVDAPGFWAKLNMFRPEVSFGKCLYLDLDNVINGPLDELCSLEPDPLIMLDDRHVPGLPNGSTILFDADRCRHLWENYAKAPREHEEIFVVRGNDYQHAYDQAYIAANANVPHWPRHFQDLLPDGYILNALSELPNAPDWRTARLIFGCGAKAKPHLSNHPAFSLR